MSGSYFDLDFVRHFRSPAVAVGARLMVSGSGLVLLVMGNVAADELVAERHRGAQHDETAGGRIDDQVARLRDGADQATDQSDRLRMGVLALGVRNPLDPTVWNPVITPRRLGMQRWFLQNEQIRSTTPGSVSLPLALIIPRDQVDTLKYIGDA
jgi:hypothetical protein